MSYKSNLLNFFISLKQHPKPIPITNSWTVSEIELPAKKIPKYLRDIELSELSSSCEVGVHIGADMLRLHLQHDIRAGNFDALIAFKTTLGWVFIGGKRSNSVNTKIVPTNKPNINYDNDLNKQVEKTWSVESNGAMKLYDRENITKEEKRTAKILETTTAKIENHCEVGILWKEKNHILNYSKDMTAHRFHLTGRKFTKNNKLAVKYKDTINEYKSKGYARKLSQEEANQTTPITNYIPHHGTQNPNKPGRCFVAI